MFTHEAKPVENPAALQAARPCVFDVLWIGGESVIRLPLSQRRDLLRDLLPDDPVFAQAVGVVGKGRDSFAAVTAAGHEGLVAKRLSSRYLPGQRTSAWQKIKPKVDVPCVVIGYRAGPEGVRALLMASLAEGQVRYVGTVELGITGGRALLSELQAIERRRPIVPASMSARWTQPKLFGIVRHAGLRPGGVWCDAVLMGWEHG